MNEERMPKRRMNLGMIGAVGHGKTTLTTAMAKTAAEHYPEGQSERLKLYQAVIRQSDPNVVGRRATVLAENLDKARAMLEEEHGKGRVGNLMCAEDDEKSRG